MAKKGGKKGKKGKGKAPKEMMSPAQIEAALATLPQPTLRGEASPRIAIRVNELVAVKFTKDPVGLVEHLKALDTGLNSINEAGWTALMRAARDGMKNHVELLLEAGATADIESSAEVADPPGRGGCVYPEGSTAHEICKIRHHSMKSVAFEKTDPNFQDILEKLTAAEAEDADDDSKGGDNLMIPPTYHNVPLIKVVGGYYYEE